MRNRLGLDASGAPVQMCRSVRMHMKQCAHAVAMCTHAHMSERVMLRCVLMPGTSHCSCGHGTGKVMLVCKVTGLQGHIGLQGYRITRPCWLARLQDYKAMLVCKVARLQRRGSFRPLAVCSAARQRAQALSVACMLHAMVVLYAATWYCVYGCG